MPAPPADPKEREESRQAAATSSKRSSSELRAELDGLRGKVDAVEDDPQLAPARRRARRHRPATCSLETARLHAGDPENVELWRRVPAACLAEIEAIYERLGVDVRPHARRELLSGPPARRREGPGRQGPRPRERRRDLRVPRRLRRADDRPEAGRRVPLRHDRPGHDPVPHERVAARRDSVRRRSSPVAPLRAALRRGPAVGLSRRRAAARQLRHRAGRRRPAVQDPLRHIRRPGRSARRSRRAGVRDRLRKTTTPAPSRCSPKKTAARWPSGSASAPSSTPTSPTTAPATTSSATTRCWP